MSNSQSTASQQSPQTEPVKNFFKNHFKFKGDLAAKIKAKQSELETWFRKHASEAPTPFYSSVDLRDAGFKITPVDANLYPAGFNNICAEDRRTAPPIFRDQIVFEMERMGKPKPEKILLLPETHTSNKFYIENLTFLVELIQEAGFEVRVGWIGEPKPDTESRQAGTGTALELDSESGKKLKVWPIEIADGVMKVDGFTPDLIIVNNDFSGGYPKHLDEVTQPMIPSHRLGWHSRKKSRHFEIYNELAREFAEITGIDPFVLTIESEEVVPVDFNEGIGVEKAIEATERVFSTIRKSYDERGIKQEPFVFLKNNSGTYGMGIMVVKSVDELKAMNRRTKNKMSVGKNKRSIESIIVQEGVPTATLVDRLPSEPVVYLVGCELIGGFLRTHPEKGVDENLNAQGMVFRKLCMTDLRDESEDPAEEEPILELVYGSIARISALAAGREIKEGFTHRGGAR